MVSALDRLTYAARQTARVAWYAGHYAAGRRLLKPMPKPDFPIGPTPSRAELTADMRAAVRARMAGHRRRPVSRAAPAVDRARRIPAPQPALFPRPAAGRCAPPWRSSTTSCRPASRATACPTTTARTSTSRATAGSREHSAAIYDTQVEVLFTGAADVMRRRALKPIAEWMAGRNQRDLRGLDVGCGTGRLLAFLHDAWPGHAPHRPRPQPALSRRSAPPDRPHRAREADRRRGREAAVRRCEPRSRRLVVPDARAAARRSARRRWPRWRAC